MATYTLNKIVQDKERHFTALRASIRGYDVREQDYLGERHIIAPVVLMVEGVHHGSGPATYYSAEELSRFPNAWNGRPVPVFHPEDGGGPISCNSPEVIEQQNVGWLFNVHFADGKLKGEIWINVRRAQEIGPAVLQYISSQQPLEVSTGLFSDTTVQSGVWQGEQYEAIAENIRPDHLALLPGSRGACSVADGCGVRTNQNKGGDLGVAKEGTTEENVSDTQGLLQRLLGFFKNEGVDIKAALETNEQPGFRSIGSQLQRMLDTFDSPAVGMHYLVDFWQDNLVYRVEPGNQAPRGASTAWYRRGYTTDDAGQLVLGSDITQVNPQPNYIEVAEDADAKAKRVRINQNTEGGTDVESGSVDTKKEDEELATNEEAKKRPERVDALINNEGSPYVEADRESLLGLEDACFDQVEITANKFLAIKKESKATPAVVVNAAGAQNNELTPEQYIINSDMPEAVKQAQLSLLQDQASQRAKMIKTITSNKAAVFTEEQLAVMDRKTLEGIYALSYKPVQVGAGGLSGSADSAEFDAPLEMPTINWDQQAKQ